MWWNPGPHLTRRMAYERGETGATRHTYTYFHGKSGIQDFFEILRRKYGTLTRAWRVAMDTDDSGLLDLREFVEATKNVGYYGNVRALWYNLDDDQSGYISLTEIDPAASVALEKFRAQCTSIFGSMDAAWDECLDKDKSGALTLPEMEEASLELGYTDMEEVRELFGLLRLEPSAFRIMKHEVCFLQKWEDRKQKTFARSWRAGSRWVNKDPYLWKHAKQNARVQPQDKTVPKVLQSSPESLSPASPISQQEKTVPKLLQSSPESLNPASSICQQDTTVPKLLQSSPEYLSPASPISQHDTTVPKLLHLPPEYLSPASPITQQDTTVPKVLQSSPEAFCPVPQISPKFARLGDIDTMSKLSSPPVSASSPAHDMKGEHSSKFHLFRKYAARRVSASASPEAHAPGSPHGHGPCSPHGHPAVLLPADAEQFEVKSDSADTVYTDIVAVDKQRAWDEFEAYLIQTFGCLSKAFDTMDTSGNGSLDREEWMHTVTRRLRFCRASEALRLFDSKVSEGNVIKWNDMGITSQEWMQYTLQKRTKEQQRRNRSMMMKPVAFGGAGKRRELAAVDHDKRMKCKPKKPDEAFWTALPTGWGFPHTEFINFKSAAAECKLKVRNDGHQSARGGHGRTLDEFSRSVLSAR